DEKLQEQAAESGILSHGGRRVLGDRERRALRRRQLRPELQHRRDRRAEDEQHEDVEEGPPCRGHRCSRTLMTVSMPFAASVSIATRIPAETQRCPIERNRASIPVRTSLAAVLETTAVARPTAIGQTSGRRHVKSDG